MAPVPRHASNISEALCALHDEAEDVLTSFVDAVGLSLTVHHYQTMKGAAEERAVSLRFQWHMTRFCTAVKRDRERECADCDAWHVPESCRAHQNPFVNRCHAGASEVIIPIHRRGTLAGVAFLGQFRDSRDQPRQLPKLGPRKVQALLALCRTVQSYLVNLCDRHDELLRATVDDRTRRVLDFIDARLLENPSLSELAAHLGLSPSHTSHLIKGMTGHSLRELKEQRKLERAKELLRVSAMTVKQIALSSGFNDDNYFCRYFRRKVGSSPMTFRRKRGVLTSP